jgi:PadR family transcriptional regulator, regulatory protein PadR
MTAAKDRLHGTLEILILKTLTWGALHGYAIGCWIEQTSRHEIVVEEGSLYPALYRMERRGWVEAEWGISELGRRAKLYSLTKLGRSQLREESAEWQRFTRAVAQVLGSDVSPEGSRVRPE